MRWLLLLALCSSAAFADVRCRQFGNTATCSDGKTEWRGHATPVGVTWADQQGRKVEQRNTPAGVKFSGAAAGEAAPVVYGALQPTGGQTAARPRAASASEWHATGASGPLYPVQHGAKPKPYPVAEVTKILHDGCGVTRPDGSCVDGESLPK